MQPGADARPLHAARRGRPARHAAWHGRAAATCRTRRVRPTPV